MQSQFPFKKKHTCFLPALDPPKPGQSENMLGARFERFWEGGKGGGGLWGIADAKNMSRKIQQPPCANVDRCNGGAPQSCTEHGVSGTARNRWHGSFCHGTARFDLGRFDMVRHGTFRLGTI